MPYWDHKKAIGSAGGLFAVLIYPHLHPRWGTEGRSPQTTCRRHFFYPPAPPMGD